INTHFGIDLPYFLLWQGIFGIVAFFVFLIGWLADLWGRKIGILILLLLMGSSALIIGIVGANSFWIFMVFYAILILGTNVNLWTIPISEESIPKKRALHGSIAFLIGLIPLYAFIGKPIADAMGWQWMYGLMGIFGLVLIIPWFFMKETKRWKTQKEEYKIKKQRIKFRETIKQFTKKDWLFVTLTGAIYICWNIAFKMATGTVKTFFLDIQLFSADQFQTILTFAGLSTILGALSIGIIMDKLGRMVAFIFSSVGATLSYLGLAFIGHPVFMVFTYYFMACFLGFLLVYIPEMFPTEIRGTATGLSLTLSRVGFVVGPLIAFAILDMVSVSAATTYIILFAVAGVIALVPLLSLFFNKYEPKGKTLETIQEEIK
ncbi:MAG: MFS transporter, partial [Candidatus Heimdallarchaeota archaeon]|nr:MFS transporter [Candidatus Heimdallarchaeota archaeon]MCK4878970.1 MFS transporter [Candidatus Heimdallarchaeota archaeon]